VRACCGERFVIEIEDLVGHAFEGEDLARASVCALAHAVHQARLSGDRIEGVIKPAGE
jgi:alpha-D-ribose 1-methylphosphonate 5-triphosphate synthase subunit PhnG